MISPAALSILTTTFAEGRERNIALGVWGAVGGFGAAAGVLLGGVLTDALSWEWIFFVNIPVGARRARARAACCSRRAATRACSSFDALGGVLVTGGLMTLVLGDHQANDCGWGSADTIGVFAARRRAARGVRRLGAARRRSR